MEKNEINFTLIYDEERIEVQTVSGEYRSLMMLLNDKLFIEDFGECLGMGRCGTCTIIIDQSKHELTSFDRNEKATLGKMAIEMPNLRLACQIAIDKNLDGAVIRIFTPMED